MNFRVGHKFFECLESTGEPKTCMHSLFLIEGVFWEFGHQNRKDRRTNFGNVQTNVNLHARPISHRMSCFKLGHNLGYSIHERVGPEGH